MSLLFKNYYLVKVTYLFRFNKTNFLPGNNLEIYSISKQDTPSLTQRKIRFERVSWYTLEGIRKSLNQQSNI